MIERRHRACLLLEAPQPVGIARKRFRQHFQRDLAPKTHIAGAIYFSHAARP